ncbi:hydroxyacid dehydrogenase [Streptomyces tsukubensis]|uniref:Hydroxyacid dehydrogenase n=1 Tax=Streptomyces tsukubensis TaxID=83656 RepID=A0A1V4AAW7_9ACTN|nr:hydroxyacid dehydrogenase [Streptomyces tsukubensis]QFR98220.1 hydroxyacid dehydrogenase [Streptomyces tsukubensis]
MSHQAASGRPRTVVVLGRGLPAEDLLPPALRSRLEEVCDLQSTVLRDGFDSPAAAPVLADAEVLLTGWGAERIDAGVLERAPRLRAVVHAAGTVKHLIAPEVYERGVQVSSAAAANAVPVAEFTLAAIILGAKRAFRLADRFRVTHEHRTADELDALPWLGTSGLTIGVIGASHTGRRLIELLRVLDVTVQLHDPYTTVEEAAGLGVDRVDLDTLVATSDVVTVHAPDLPETRHMLDRRRLSLMRAGSLLINTARGALIDTEALTEQVTSGRLDAVLDVTDPEPLPADHPLWSHSGAFVTPHLAGALDNEVRRLGAVAVEEIARYASGRPLLHRVRPEELGRIA